MSFINLCNNATIFIQNDFITIEIKIEEKKY